MSYIQTSLVAFAALTFALIAPGVAGAPLDLDAEADLDQFGTCYGASGGSDGQFGYYCTGVYRGNGYTCVGFYQVYSSDGRWSCTATFYDS